MCVCVQCVCVPLQRDTCVPEEEGACWCVCVCVCVYAMCESSYAYVCDHQMYIMLSSSGASTGPFLCVPSVYMCMYVCVCVWMATYRNRYTQYVRIHIHGTSGIDQNQLHISPYVCMYTTQNHIPSSPHIHIMHTYTPEMILLCSTTHTYTHTEPCVCVG